MIIKVKEIFQSILNTGIKSELDNYTAFLIYGLNFISLAGATSVLLAFPVAGLDVVYFFIPGCSLFLVFLSILWLNSRNNYGLAKFALFGVFPLVQFCNMMFFDMANGGIALTIMPMLLISPLAIKNKGLKVVTIIFLLFVSFFPLRDHLYELGIYFIHNALSAMIIMMIIVYFLFNYFQKTIENLKNRNDILKFQNEELEYLIQQNDHKTELLGILSHDLKGPANAFDDLSKKVAFLIKNKRIDELQEFGEYIEIAGKKIFKDISRLLNWSISQKKEIVIQEEHFSPFELVMRIIQKLVLQNPNKKINIENRIPKTLTINTDNNILEIVLENLLSNAVHNSPEEEPVIISSESSQIKFVTCINNQGPILDMKIVNWAKEGKFMKSKRGHGLGIGICFSLIKFLNGRIKYESNEKVGTNVKVSIPILR